MIANDPDNAMTPSGTLSFRIQDDIEDASAFKIGKIKQPHKSNTFFKSFLSNPRSDKWFDYNVKTIGPRNEGQL